MKLSILCDIDGFVIDVSPVKADTSGFYIMFNGRGYAKNLGHVIYDDVIVPNDYLPYRYSYSEKSGWRLNESFMYTMHEKILKQDLHLAALMNVLHEKGILDSNDLVHINEEFTCE